MRPQGEIRRFDSPRWRETKQGTGYSVQIESFALSPDGAILAVGTTDGSKLDCPILLFDFQSGRQIAELSGHKGNEWSANRSLVFASNTRLVSAGADNTVRVWDIAARKAAHQLKMAADSSVSALVVSSDGKLAYCAGDEQGSSYWSVWDVATGKQLHREGKLPGQFAQLALSPDGRTLALSVGVGELEKDGGSNELRLYSLADRKELRRWKTHEGRFPHAMPLRLLQTDGPSPRAGLIRKSAAGTLGPARN